MSLEELDTIINKDSHFEEGISELKNFLSLLKIKKGDEITVKHIINKTNIKKIILNKLLEECVSENLFKKITYYKCPIKNQTIEKINDSIPIFPITTYCDLCQKEHVIKKEHVLLKYKINFDIEHNLHEKIDNSMKNKQYDFIIATVVQAEYDAVRKILNNIKQFSIEKIICIEGTITSLNNKEYKICLFKISDMGNPNSAAVSSTILSQLKTPYLIKIGIAAGYRVENELGDVVISKTIFCYEYKKEEENKSIKRTNTHPTSLTLINKMDNFDWKGYNNGISKSKMHIGPIGTGQKLIKKQALMEEIKEINDKICAVEMESEGIALAASQRKDLVEVMIINGISDYGDGEKNDDWHVRSANAAANLFKDFIENGMMEI